MRCCWLDERKGTFTLAPNEGDQAEVNNCYFWDWWNLSELYRPFPSSGNRKQLESLDGLNWFPIGTMPETSAEPFNVGTFEIHGVPEVGIVLRDSLVLDQARKSASQSRIRLTHEVTQGTGIGGNATLL